jgi:hypothetical protein
MNSQTITSIQSLPNLQNPTHSPVEEQGIAWFVSRGLEIMAELISNKVQESLFERLLALSRQSQLREQTDVAFLTLSAAYHAAYEPTHLETVIVEARRRADEWTVGLDECGSVRPDNYRMLAEEAQEMKQSFSAVAGDE